ncbi:MAG: hypothetical protein D6702_03615 [Planctomycetota bacterium]|nr:MAG: hypothetical protein D6702_03615 [Planctomycetota bacterium]
MASLCSFSEYMIQKAVEMESNGKNEAEYSTLCFALFPSAPKAAAAAFSNRVREIQKGNEITASTELKNISCRESNPIQVVQLDIGVLLPSDLDYGGVLAYIELTSTGQGFMSESGYLAFLQRRNEEWSVMDMKRIWQS